MWKYPPGSMCDYQKLWGKIVDNQKYTLQGHFYLFLSGPNSSRDRRIGDKSPSKPYLYNFQKKIGQSLLCIQDYSQIRILILHKKHKHTIHWGSSYSHNVPHNTQFNSEIHNYSNSSKIHTNSFLENQFFKQL